MSDPLRLALGTLTVLRVPPPRLVDRRVAGWAMTAAPLAGLLLALPCAALLWLAKDAERSLPPLVAATLTVALLALLTRGLHLDGLADTADGLGSAKPPAEALAVMRRGDIGPFGVLSVVLVVLAQVAALASLLDDGRAVPAVLAAVTVSRCVLPLVCLRGIPAARPDGLGSTVAGSVAPAQVLASLGCTLAVLGAAAVLDPGSLPRMLVLGMVVPLTVGAVLGWWCVRRLGGVSGDVLGACVEVTLTAALVLLSSQQG